MLGRRQRGDTISASQQWCSRAAAARRRPGFARLGKRQRGDTIVEVLIAIAVVSFVLVAAYVTANKNSLITQDTQEHGQALQLATTQLEFLHTNTAVSNGSCFDNTGKVATTSADCVVKTDGTKDTNGTQPQYTITITKTSGTTYTVSVAWDTLGSTSKGNVTLYYQQP